MKHGMASLGGNLYARKEVGAGEYLTLFGPLGQERGKLSLSNQQAWELLQIMLGDIERLAAAQHIDALEEEQQMIALHQVHQALSLEQESEEDLAWTGDFETKRATMDRGIEAAAILRKVVDSWGLRLRTLDTAMQNAELLLADEQAAEAEKTDQGVDPWLGEGNQNMPAR